MATTESKELTVQDKLEMRNGKCVSLRCADECGAYAHAKKLDGYDTCVCGHTRWSHSKN